MVFLSEQATDSITSASPAAATLTTRRLPGVNLSLISL
jgi:hypothetical protein